jgi:ribonuclease-3
VPERRRQVVTHRSWAASHADSYERLEFLGDSVLQLVVTAELLRRHPEASEGDLAWMRQAVVDRESCAEAARAAGLPEEMVAAAPERERAAARRMSGQPGVQAALVEALIGACWTDLGPVETEQAVLAAFAPALDRAVPGRRDPKTALQEEAARRRLEVRYELVRMEGPPHERTFESRALVGGRPLGVGRGRSKQASEREAAVAALARLEAGEG